MSQLIESICIKNGEIQNLDLHQNRVNHSRYKLFGKFDELDLAGSIAAELGRIDLKSETVKCRILYDQKLHFIELIPYQMRAIQSLRIVEDNFIEYRYKFSNRDAFQLLKDSVTEDEILICKQGQITDTSYSNVVFFDGQDWVTPTSYLLNGVMRQSLLRSGKMREKEIHLKDLSSFTSFKLINAMMDLDESPELDISIIK